MNTTTETCEVCKCRWLNCECGDKVVPFQTPVSRARQPAPPPEKKKSLHPSDVAHIKFTSAVDDGYYWIDNSMDIAKLFAFLKVNKIKINVGDPDL